METINQQMKQSIRNFDSRGVVRRVPEAVPA